MRLSLTALLLILIFAAQSKAEQCYDGVVDCSNWSRSSSSSASSSSTGGKIKINPAAVPTAEGYGIEGISYKTYVDLGLVRGNGRIGAAISPSNSEETFFGPPGFAVPSETLERKINRDKYPSQKITLATAFDVAQNKSNWLKSYSLKAGVMGRYNKLTSAISPGMGLSGNLGPISFGGSIYEDETQLSTLDIYDQKTTYRYQVRTYNVGLFLSSLLLDYSHMALNTSEAPSVRIYTASLFVGKFILTASKRLEDSSNPYFNFETLALETRQVKEEYFGGIQYTLTKNLMVGALYNYYLLHEYAATATLFF